MAIVALMCLLAAGIGLQEIFAESIKFQWLFFIAIGVLIATHSLED